MTSIGNYDSRCCGNFLSAGTSSELFRTSSELFRTSNELFRTSSELIRTSSELEELIVN